MINDPYILFTIVCASENDSKCACLYSLIQTHKVFYAWVKNNIKHVKINLTVKNVFVERITYSLNGKEHRENDLPAEIWADGSQFWYKNGELHRDNDLPAVIDEDCSQYWYKNGERHRKGDLPAYIGADGAKWWYKNGKFHRKNDLPAIIWPSGTKAWWINGKRINYGYDD